MTAKFEYSKYTNKRGEIKIWLIIGSILIIIALLAYPKSIVYDDYWTLKLTEFNLLTFLAIVWFSDFFNWSLWKLAGGYKETSRWSF